MEMKLVNNEPVAVIAIDRGTGYIETVTSCDREDAWKYAKHYRSIGYKARIVEYDTLEQLLENERIEKSAQRRYEQSMMQ